MQTSSDEVEETRQELYGLVTQRSWIPAVGGTFLYLGAYFYKAQLGAAVWEAIICWMAGLFVLGFWLLNLFCLTLKRARLQMEEEESSKPSRTSRSVRPEVHTPFPPDRRSA